MNNISFYTVEYWQNNWDEMITRVENGETLGIEDKGNRAIMIPADDEIVKIHTILNNDAS